MSDLDKLRAEVKRLRAVVEEVRDVLRAAPDESATDAAQRAVGKAERRGRSDGRIDVVEELSRMAEEAQREVAKASTIDGVLIANARAHALREAARSVGRAS